MEYKSIAEFVVNYREELMIFGIGLFLTWGYLEDRYNNKDLKERDPLKLSEIKKSLENILGKSL